MLSLEFCSPIGRQYLFVIIVNLCIVNFGLAIGWSSAILVKVSDTETSPLDEPITSTQGSWIVSSVNITSLFALCISASLVDHVGRKLCFMMSAALRIIGVVFYLLTTQVWMLVVGRLFNGLADGLGFAVVSVYASEVANTEIRGSLGAILQISSATGILIGLTAGPYMTYMGFNILVLCMALVAIVPLPFMPDSPYFLYKKGRKDEAKEVLKFFRGSEILAEKEMKEYDTIVEEPLSLMELLRNKAVLKSFGFALLIGAGVQLSGSSVLQYYLQTILVSTGTQISSEIASMILGCVQLVGSVVSIIFLVDRFKRKLLFCAGQFGNMIGLLGLGIFFQLSSNSGWEVTGFLNVLPLLSLILVNVSNSAGVASVMWMMLAELFDGRARGYGVSLATGAVNLLLLILSFVFPLITELVGPEIPFWMFGAFAGLLTVIVAVTVPETKDKTFAEIQAELAGEKNYDRTNIVLKEVDVPATVSVAYDNDKP